MKEKEKKKEKKKGKKKGPDFQLSIARSGREREVKKKRKGGSS